MKIGMAYIITFLLLAIIEHLIKTYSGINIQAMYIFTSIIIGHIVIYHINNNKTYTKWLVAILGLYVIVTGAITTYYKPFAILSNILKLIVAFLILYIIYSVIRRRYTDKEEKVETVEGEWTVDKETGKAELVEGEWSETDSDDDKKEL